jgi:hypothetical protein
MVDGSDSGEDRGIATGISIDHGSRKGAKEEKKRRVLGIGVLISKSAERRDIGDRERHEWLGLGSMDSV